MKKFFKRFFLVLLLTFIVIQFFRPEKNQSDVVGTNDITKKYLVPENVLAILKTSCYDCHSNNTVYPWYSKIQPLAWLLNNHIQDGKKDLNFSEFLSYRIRRQYVKLEQINDLVKKDEMPLDSYLWFHKNAKLSAEQKLTIANWVVATRDSIKAHQPEDSLKKPQQPQSSPAK